MDMLSSLAQQLALIIIIDADADARLAVKSFELEIIPSWWTGDTGLVLNQTDIS